MKTTFKYIVTAFAVCAALVSCQKENYSDKNDDTPAVGNVRVIEAHFSAATKSTLGGEKGRTPLFVNGDKIMASNGTSKEECTVSVDDKGVATFATELTGDLKAVYPSAAAKMNDNGIDIDGVIVPATQDGTFAKANIAKATIASSDNSAEFINQTSLLRLYVDESIGVKSITITATGEANIADGSKTITIDPEGDDTLDKVTVDNPDKRICYVAVLPGTFTLTFTSVTTTQTIYEDSKVEKTITKTLASSTLYNVFLPYYIDLEDAGKWGYCNVGAFLPEDAGMYFAWGEITGHRPATDGEGAFTFGKENAGFATNFSNCPYYIGDNKCTKYMLTGYEDYWGGTGSPDNLTVLEASDDAATAYWGEGWRMPKIEEFEALIELCSNKFESGYWFGTSPYTILLPAAGAGYGDKLDTSDGTGIYWSSSLNIDDGDYQGPANGNDFEFYTEDTPYIGCSSRSLGCSIRPIVNTAPAISYNTPEQYERDNW